MLWKAEQKSVNHDLMEGSLCLQMKGLMKECVILSGTVFFEPTSQVPIFWSHLGHIMARKRAKKARLAYI